MDQVPHTIKSTILDFGADKISRRLMEGISYESLIYPHEPESQQRH